MKFSGTIDEKLKFMADEPERWNAAREKFVGKKVAVDIRHFRKTRSHEQNRYYWGVVIKLFESETGTDKWDCHEILKSRFLKEVKTIESAGKMLEIVAVNSTADLKTTGFEDYLRECRNWLSLEFGIYVPLPHECPDESYNFNLY